MQGTSRIFRAGGGIIGVISWVDGTSPGNGIGQFIVDRTACDRIWYISNALWQHIIDRVLNRAVFVICDCKGVSDRVTYHGFCNICSFHNIIRQAVNINIGATDKDVFKFVRVGFKVAIQAVAFFGILIPENVHREGVSSRVGCRQHNFVITCGWVNRHHASRKGDRITDRTLPVLDNQEIDVI